LRNLPLIPRDSPNVIRLRNYSLFQEAWKSTDCRRVDDPTYEKREQLLLWYHDDFLPVALGQEEYAKKIHHCSSPVSLRDAGNGKRLPTATSVGEAFGLFVYQNCRAK
jgi:hypothetical protein